MEAPKPKLAEEVQGDDLAEAIRKISDGVTRLTRSGLNREAIITLLSYETKVSRRDIDKVLDGLSDLAKKYTKR